MYDNTDLLRITKLNNDKWSSGSYSMLSLKIELEDESKEEDNPTIIHEYTHYLQNISTIYGFTKIDDYIRLFLSIFAYFGSAEDDPILPLNKNLGLQDRLKNKNLENLLASKYVGMSWKDGTYSFEDYDADDYEIIQENMYNNFSGKTIEMYYIVIDNVKIPLNEVVIKENMAFMNTITSSTHPKKNISNDVLSFKYKEYNAIYDYINNYLPGKNSVFLTYRICEIGLNLLPIEKNMYKILAFVETNHVDLMDFTEDDIIKVIEEEFNYCLVLKAFCNGIEKVITERKSLLEKIISTDNNEFVSIVKQYYDYILNGLKLRLKYKTFYYMDKNDKGLEKLIESVGSPYIYYKYKGTVKNFKSIGKYFLDDFVYLHVALEVFSCAYFEELNICPLYFSKICNFSKNEFCLNDCLQDYNKPAYKNCWLNNALDCTGIKSLKRYYSK